jgi:hypothetical protein
MLAMLGGCATNPRSTSGDGGQAGDLPCLVVQHAPRLDGRHRGLWLKAPRIADFYRIERSREPRDVDRDVDLRLLSDGNSLYLSAAVRDPDLVAPRTSETVAGGTLRSGGDVLELFLWPRHVKPRAYAEIHVYPDGATWQAMHLDRKGNPQPWPAPLRFVSRRPARQTDPWIVQMAIPWSALTRADAQPSGSPVEHRILLTRIDVNRDGSGGWQTHHYATAPLSTLWFHMIEQYGRLRLIRSASEAESSDPSCP